MASDWRKCKLLNVGDKRAVKALYEAATFESEAFFFRKEPMRHMTGLVKMLAAKIVELEAKPIAARRRKE